MLQCRRHFTSCEYINEGRLKVSIWKLLKKPITSESKSKNLAGYLHLFNILLSCKKLANLWPPLHDWIITFPYDCILRPRKGRINYTLTSAKMLLAAWLPRALKLAIWLSPGTFCNICVKPIRHTIIKWQLHYFKALATFIAIQLDIQSKLPAQNLYTPSGTNCLDGSYVSMYESLWSI